MRLFDIMKGKHIIQQTARELGKSEQEVRADLQFLVDDYWERDTPTAKHSRALLFPHGKPSPDEYIIVLARHTKRRLKRDSSPLSPK